MISYSRSLRNIRKVADQATPEEVLEGKFWYPQAYQDCLRVAEEYEVPVELVVDIISVTSPTIRWERNITLSGAMLKTHREGRLTEFIGDGYQRNIEKAKEMIWRFFEFGEWGGILSGPKVTSFANCILHYSRPQLPVVDVRAFSIAAGKRYTVQTMPSVNSNRLWIIRRAFTEVAESRGFLPQELQAITWLTWRRLVAEKGEKI